MKPTTFTPIEELRMRLVARFPQTNKNHLREDNLTEIEKDSYDRPILITHIAVFSEKAFSEFTNHFLDQHEWMNKLGGGSSSFVPEGGWVEGVRKRMGQIYNFTPKEKRAYESMSYDFGILCIVEDGSDQVIVNPEGHAYARYVGEIVK